MLSPATDALLAAHLQLWLLLHLLHRSSFQLHTHLDLRPLPGRVLTLRPMMTSPVLIWYVCSMGTLAWQHENIWLRLSGCHIVLVNCLHPSLQTSCFWLAWHHVQVLLNNHCFATHIVMLADSDHHNKALYIFSLVGECLC